jgi:L-lactate dehydrogenase
MTANPSASRRLISILHSGIADELLLLDVRPELAEGEAMDLAHAASF